MSEQPALQARDVHKSFVQGDREIMVLDGVQLTVQAGDTVAIIGASGSGKSTLMHLLAGLDVPDRGQVTIDGLSIGELSEQARGRLRNRELGFVYQFHHLLAEFTAGENVAMPCLVRGMARPEALARAREYLAAVGLAARCEHRPAALSGGERQRVAIARALVNGPRWVLADEPTGNLDENTAGQVFDLLLELNQRNGASLIIVTHNPQLLTSVDHCHELKGGKLLPLAPREPSPPR